MELECMMRERCDLFQMKFYLILHENMCAFDRGGVWRWLWWLTLSEHWLFVKCYRKRIRITSSHHLHDNDHSLITQNVFTTLPFLVKPIGNRCQSAITSRLNGSVSPTEMTSLLENNQQSRKKCSSFGTTFAIRSRSNILMCLGRERNRFAFETNQRKKQQRKIQINLVLMRADCRPHRRHCCKAKTIPKTSRMDQHYVVLVYTNAVAGLPTTAILASVVTDAFTCCLAFNRYTDLRFILPPSSSNSLFLLLLLILFHFFHPQVALVRRFSGRFLLFCPLIW